MAISNLRKSNISKFLPIVSNDEVMSALLSPSTKDSDEEDLTYAIFNDQNLLDIDIILDLKKSTYESNQDAYKKLNNIVSSILVTTFHSLTANISFTKDILDFISEETFKSLNAAYKNDEAVKSKVKDLHEIIMNQIGDFIKVVHEDYKIYYPDGKKLLSETNFSIKKKIPAKDKKLYVYENQFGLLGFNSKQKSKRSKKYTLALNKDVSGVVARDNTAHSLEPNGRGSIFNAREVVDYKLKQSTKKSLNPNDPQDNGLEGFLNFVDGNDELKIREDTASISCIMMNNPKMRAGTKNSLELATFFNSLSTIELSKCLPYLDVKFILPGEVKTKGANVFKTASITQFLDGTNSSDFNLSSNYKTLEASFVRDAGIKGGGNTRKQNAVETNFSAFTMPQTINNFDESYVGHLESYSKELKTNKDTLFERNNTVHDYTKPFLTIKSFNIDVAPTQGLMSFKTGKLSLVLHDKARMSDIAPFIKPDLFGSFGAEIAIKYGWSHMDAVNENITSNQKKEYNYFAKFLNEKKVYEKYIITNSSYSIDANGQVNIDLAIAMKGPVSIRAINFEAEKPKKIGIDLIEYKVKLLDKKKKAASGKVSITYSSLNSNKDAIESEFKSNLNKNSKKKLKKINAMWSVYNGKKSKSTAIKKSRAKENDVQWIRYIAQFFESLGVDGNASSVILTYDTKKISKAETDISEMTTVEKDYIWSVYASFVSLLRNAINTIDKGRKEQAKKIDGLLQKLTDGLSLEDAFFDVENYTDVQGITDEALYAKNKDQAKFYSSQTGLDSNSSNKKELTSYVSLGNIILAVVGSHLSFSRGYDEIQIISYTLNDYAGAASNKNISSLLVDKVELNQFLSDLFKNGAQYTLESLLTQIIKKFFTTRYCYNYGLKDLYKINENGNVEPNSDSKKPNEFEKVVNERLQLIQKQKYGLATEDNLVPDISFVMPKVKLSFDTMTTDNSGGNDTILRISVFDQNDNPFTSVTSIMNKIFDSDVQSAVFDINKRRIALKSLALKSKNYSKAKAEFVRENKVLLDSLKGKGLLKEVGGVLVINTSEKYAFDSVKERLKGFMPSLTYGTHNSAIIDASISTINEAKLNTVYLTRPGRNDAKTKTRARFKQDLPLRILPSQVSLSIFGCPFVNFAQYLFLDFETNTTVDNQYAVTGIKHEITPGKFTTQLTLSYGDAYGKYENIVDTLSRTAQETEQGTTDVKPDEPLSSRDLFIKDMTATKNNMSLIEIKNKNKSLKDISASVTKYSDLVLKNDNLMYDTSIKSIRIINYKNKDEVFYKINAWKSKDLIDIIPGAFGLPSEGPPEEIPHIDIEELIIAVSESNKTKTKTHIIDISKKILKPSFEFSINNASETLTDLLIRDNENIKKGLKSWKKINLTDLKFYTDLVKSQIKLFDALLKLFVFPYLKITIGNISNKDDIVNIEFSEENKRLFQNRIENVYFENLNSSIKKEMLAEIKDSVVSKLDKTSKINKYGKANCMIEGIEFANNGKILLTFTYDVSKKKQTKKSSFKINIGGILSQHNMAELNGSNPYSEIRQWSVPKGLVDNIKYD